MESTEREIPAIFGYLTHRHCGFVNVNVSPTCWANVGLLSCLFDRTRYYSLVMVLNFNAEVQTMFLECRTFLICTVVNKPTLMMCRCKCSISSYCINKVIGTHIHLCSVYALSMSSCTLFYK